MCFPNLKLIFSIKRMCSHFTALRPTPNASTNSWHSPLNRTRSGQIEHRGTFTNVLYPIIPRLFHNNIAIGKSLESSNLSIVLARAPIPHYRQHPPSIKTMIPFQHLQRFNMRDRRTATSHQPFPRYEYTFQRRLIKC
jgi:hypothetical protein